MRIVLILWILLVFLSMGTGIGAEEPEPGTFRGKEIQVEAVVFSIPPSEALTLMESPEKAGEAVSGMVEQREGIVELATLETVVRGEKPWGRVRKDDIELDFEFVIGKTGESAAMLGIVKGGGFSFQFDGGVQAGIPAFAGITTRYVNGKPEFLAVFVTAEAKGGGL